MEPNERKRETEPNNYAPRIRRRRRGIALASLAGGAFGVVALLAILAPLAAATSVASFSAPYTGGKLVQIRDPVAQGCGESTIVKVPATFVLSTGKATGQVTTSAGVCNTADSQASYDGTVGVKALGFAASTAGSVKVTAKWTVTWNVSSSMSSAAANAGGQATVEIYLIVKITDTTTGKTTTAPTVFIVQKDLASGTTYRAGASGVSYSATLSGYTLVAGHGYQVYAALAFSAQSVVPQGAASGSATSAAVDLGSTGHGGQLTSISVG
jgi:hypothetical protein